MGCFIAIDVETANRHQGSICQIGLACFDDGALAWQWSALVDPEGEFEPFNIDIHRITPQRVAGAAKWPAVMECIATSLSGQTIVSHTRFDQIALAAASERYGLTLPDSRWIDSHAIARQVWPDMGRHRLRDLCETLGIELNHHDALSDATACGRIILAGLQASGLTLEQLIARQAPPRPSASQRSSARRRGERHQRDFTTVGAANGPLRGQVVVFTGAFEGGKRAISELAATAGCDVDENVAKSRTTMLVVGRRDPADWNGAEKSGKHRRAEEALAEGYKIEIMSEEQFRTLLQHAVTGALSATV
jgi:DNA polymerase III subunit epsilon